MRLKEIWKNIPGYEGRYEASNKGRVRSLLKKGHFNVPSSGAYHLLAIHCRPDGYLSTTLARGGGKLIHRLVASAFLGDIPKGKHVAHLDGCKDNNSVSNLKICSPKENEAHKEIHGKARRGSAPRGSENKFAKLTDADVVRIRLMGHRGVYQKDIAAEFGINQVTVSSILRRKTWKHV